MAKILNWLIVWVCVHMQWCQECWVCLVQQISAEEAHMASCRHRISFCNSIEYKCQSRDCLQRIYYFDRIAFYHTFWEMTNCSNVRNGGHNAHTCAQKVCTGEVRMVPFYYMHITNAVWIMSANLLACKTQCGMWHDVAWHGHDKLVRINRRWVDSSNAKPPIWHNQNISPKCVYVCWVSASKLIDISLKLSTKYHSPVMRSVFYDGMMECVGCAEFVYILYIPI